MKGGIVFILTLICITIYGQRGDNPFDVTPTPQDLERGSQVPMDSITDDTTAQVISANENPFEVSPIPLRKQKIQIDRIDPQGQDSVAPLILSFTNFPLWIVLISLILLAYQVYRKRDHYIVMLRALLNENYMKVLNFSENPFMSLSALLGLAIFVLNVGLNVYLISNYYFGQSLYIYVCLLFVLIYFGARFVINPFVAFVFNVSKESKLYTVTITTIYNLIGIVFLALNMIIVLSANALISFTLYLSIFVLFIYLFVKYFKVSRIGRSFLNNYTFHFFIYFCIFEISPWIVLYKLLAV